MTLLSITARSRIGRRLPMSSLMRLWPRPARGDLSQYKRPGPQPLRKPIDTVRVFAPAFAVVVAIAVGMALGRFV